MANNQEYENQIKEKAVNENDVEKYYKISSIIEEMASKNPNISPEKVSMLKGYYQGDTRSIETIITELNEYSSARPQVEQPTIFNKNSEDIRNVVETAASMHETVHTTSAPLPEPMPEPIDVELSDMFVPNTPSSAYQGLDTKTENPKQFVKTTKESNEGGYSDTATMVMLTTAGFFSIITIILAIAALI